MTTDQKWLRFFSKFGPVERISKKLRYPGIALATGVTFSNAGRFIYGTGCGIGEGSNIFVSENSALILGANCYVGRYVELGSNPYISLGSHSSVQDRCILLGNVVIGRYCRIAPNVYLSSGRHCFDLQPSCLIADQDDYVSHRQELTAASRDRILIDDDCWLGINVVVLPGLSIGRGAVVGANSVVTKDVPPYTVVAGAPAREIRKRLDFSPPSGISHSNSDDRPYFYAGFEVSQASLKKYGQFGGIAAHGELTVCLDASSGSVLILVAKSLEPGICTLGFGSQRRQISDVFQEIAFELGAERSASTRLTVTVEPATATVVVSQARIQ